MLSIILAVLTIGLPLIGAIGARLGWLPPLPGFAVAFGGGGLAGLVALIVGLVGIFLGLRSGTGIPGYTWLTTLVGLLLVGTLAALVLSGRDHPRINDVSTDLQNPPRFAGETPGPLPTRLRNVLKSAYADVRTARVAMSQEAAFARGLDAARTLGWEIVSEDPSSGTFVGTSTSTWFRFVDDISVRVRADGDGALVDVRSRSRDGKGDFGVNAARIRQFVATVTAG